MIDNPNAVAWTGAIFDFKIRLANETLTFRNSLEDVLRWEKNQKRPWGKDLGLTGFLYLAWLAGRRLGVIEPGQFDTWAGLVVDYTLDGVARDDKGDEIPAFVDEDELDDDLEDYAGGNLIADPTLPAQSDDYSIG